MTAEIQPVLTIADLDVMPDNENCYEIIAAGFPLRGKEYFAGLNKFADRLAGP